MAGMTSPAPEQSESSPTSYPITQTVLGNGLRVIASPDHGAPSVAVNLWYDVGSRARGAGPDRLRPPVRAHHVPGLGQRRRPASTSGCCRPPAPSVNATTWFDRTNYFETLPTGGLDLALWLEADRLGTLLDALTQENLDNQREVVKEEKRQRYDNVPYGDAMQRLIELTFPPDHPYGHTTIGSMDDLNAATLEDVRAFFAHPLPAQQRRADDRRRRRARGRLRPGRALLRRRWPPDRSRPTRSTTPLPPLTGLPRDETSAAVPADAVYLTWRLPTRDTARVRRRSTWRAAILGHGQTSRLHRALVRGAERGRERRGDAPWG